MHDLDRGCHSFVRLEIEFYFQFRRSNRIGSGVTKFRGLERFGEIPRQVYALGLVMYACDDLA